MCRWTHNLSVWILLLHVLVYSKCVMNLKFLLNLIEKMDERGLVCEKMKLLYFCISHKHKRLTIDLLLLAHMPL